MGGGQEVSLSAVVAHLLIRVTHKSIFPLARRDTEANDAFAHITRHVMS